MSNFGKIDDYDLVDRTRPESSGPNVYTNFILSLARGLTCRSRRRLENVLNNASLAHVVIHNGKKK